MDPTGSTCWTLIRGAADGCDSNREDFARLYAPVIRSYLTARWRGTPHLRDLEDAVQEVFIDCLRDQGALARFEAERPGGFRGFLYGVTRIVALRFERMAGRNRAAGGDGLDLDALEADVPSLSTVFDRAWALAVLREAANLQRERARQRGADAERRTELLRLRFHDGLPIRDIARKWDVPPKQLHREYARAQREFQSALMEVVSVQHPGSPREVELQCAALIDLLG